MADLAIRLPHPAWKLRGREDRGTAVCRFLTNLPPHMQHLNYTLVQTLVPVGLQSVEEIEAIVHQATRPSVWPNWPPQHA